MMYSFFLASIVCLSCTTVRAADLHIHAFAWPDATNVTGHVKSCTFMPGMPIPQTYASVPLTEQTVFIPMMGTLFLFYVGHTGNVSSVNLQVGGWTPGGSVDAVAVKPYQGFLDLGSWSNVAVAMILN
jgi:hypothetical protein